MVCLTLLSVFILGAINCAAGEYSLQLDENTGTTTSQKQSYHHAIEQLLQIMEEKALNQVNIDEAELQQQQFDNEPDKELTVECDEQNGEALCRVKSEYSSRHKDRRWKWSCTKVSTVPTSDCSWTSFVNEWDKPLLYFCPEDYVMSGISSVHNNYREDRRWKIKCCRAEGYQTESCSVTPQYINDFREQIDYESKVDCESNLGEIEKGRAFTGLYSFHDNGKEDRRWKVFQCDYGMIMKPIMIRPTDPTTTEVVPSVVPTDSEVTEPPRSVLDLSVSCGSGNIAINSGTAQTFFPTVSGVVDKIAIWIEPGMWHSASFALQVIEGKPDSQNVLGESPVLVTAVAGPDKFYDFHFPSPITVNAGTEYSWKLVRKNQDNNVGAFNQCPDSIPGNGYWLASHSFSNYDYPFKLYVLAEVKE